MNKRNLDYSDDSYAFSYKETKNGKVFVYWYNKQVSIIKRKKASKFLAKISRANEEEKQLIMAKITGNFKRGNER